MCIYNHFGNLLERQFSKKKSCCPSYKWSPIQVDECTDQKCEERSKVVSYIGSCISGLIQEAEDGSDRCEYNHMNEFLCFCETKRIMKDSLTDQRAKQRLTSPPSKKYVSHFLKHFLECCNNVTTEVLIYAIMLFKRLLKTTGWKLTPTTWRPLMLTAITVAVKSEGFASLPLSALHHIYPLFTVQEFAKLELTFLKLVDYRVFVNYEQFFHELETMMTSQQGVFPKFFAPENSGNNEDYE